MKLEHVKRADGFAGGAFGPLAISVWEKTPTIAWAQLAASVLGEVARQHPEILVMAILAPGCPSPDGAVRDIISRELQRYPKQIKAVANVVEGEGFGAAALRGALTGMSLVLRPGYPAKAFSTVREAAEFLGADGTLRPSVIRDAAAQLRAIPFSSALV
jgi:hypothetical protein